MSKEEEDAKGISDYEREIKDKYGFWHDLYQISGNDPRIIDEWLLRPAVEFLNMLKYNYEYSKLEAARNKRGN